MDIGFAVVLACGVAGALWMAHCLQEIRSEGTSTGSSVRRAGPLAVEPVATSSLTLSEQLAEIRARRAQMR